jgi:hypothetical protein
VTLRFLITTVAPRTPATPRENVLNDSFTTSGALNESFRTPGPARHPAPGPAPHPDTPEGTRS